MSWNPFSRQVVPKQKAISAVIERDYDREVSKLNQMEDSTKKLHKDMKKYTDTLSVMSKCEERLVSSLQSVAPLLSSQQLEHTQQLVDSIERYSQIHYRTHAALNTMVNSANKVVTEPMKTWCSVYPNVHGVMKKREQCVHEVNKCQSKVEKYQEKERTGANLAKLGQYKKALMGCKCEFDRENALLMRELPALYDQRVTYLQPSLSALTQAQMSFYSELNSCYQAVCQPSADDDPGSNPAVAAAGLLTDVNQQRLQVEDINKQLAHIKALSIVVDD